MPSLSRIGKLKRRGRGLSEVGPLEVAPRHHPRSAEEWVQEFGKEGRFRVEIGPGKGDFLRQLALRHPEDNLIGLEIKRTRAVWIEEKLLRAGIENVRMVTGDAIQVFPRLFRPGSLTAIHVNFPDPWPRDRNERRRLGRPWLGLAAAQLLERGGLLYFVTDRPDRAEDALVALDPHPHLENLHGEGNLVHELEGYIPTIHEKKFRAQGRTIHYLVYRRV